MTGFWRWHDRHVRIFPTTGWKIIEENWTCQVRLGQYFPVQAKSDMRHSFLDHNHRFQGSHIQVKRLILTWATLEASSSAASSSLNVAQAEPLRKELKFCALYAVKLRYPRFYRLIWFFRRLLIIYFCLIWYLIIRFWYIEFATYGKILTLSDLASPCFLDFFIRSFQNSRNLGHVEPVAKITQKSIVKSSKIQICEVNGISGIRFTVLMIY